MNIYLAARYSRRLELCGYREQIRAAGHTVDAVWLNGEHLPHDYCDGKPGAYRIGSKLRPGERLSPSDQSDSAAKLRQKFAADDFMDVFSCDMLIAFTEEPRSEKSRGGRHVELGIALGMMKRVWIVGPRENIFCWLENVRQFDSFALALDFLAHEARERERYRREAVPQ